MGKVCSVCKIEKDFLHFTKMKTRIDGYGRVCKSCRKLDLPDDTFTNKENIKKNKFNCKIKKPETDCGYVYIFYFNDLIKIGKSVDPFKRANSLSIPVEKIFYGKTDNMNSLEKYLHHKYSKYNHGLEWFKNVCVDSILEELNKFCIETGEVIFNYNYGKTITSKNDFKKSEQEIKEIEFDKKWKKEKMSFRIFDSNNEILRKRFLSLGLCNGCEYKPDKNETCYSCVDSKRQKVASMIHSDVFQNQYDF